MTLPVLQPSQQTALALVALAVAVVAAGIALVAFVRLRKVRRSFAVLWAGGQSDIATVAAAQERRIAGLVEQLAATRADIVAVRGDVAQSLRNVAVVRYDAFGDMGGRLSFSCAVVDDAGDGLVISSIHARGESRTYAKGIVGGGSEITLTPEEQQALSAARSAHGAHTRRPLHGSPKASARSPRTTVGP